MLFPFLFGPRNSCKNAFLGDLRKSLIPIILPSFSHYNQQNVKDSKGTLIISYGKLTGDYDYARKVTLNYGHQLLGINLKQTIPFKAASLVNDWAQLKYIDVLYVMGPKACVHPDAWKHTAHIVEGALTLDLMDAAPDSHTTDFTKEENRVKIVLPEGKNIYEVRTHKYLGRSNTIITTLFPGEVKIFALLPYKRKAINVDGKLTASGQISYRIKLVNTLGKKSAGIVRLEVYSEGKLKEWYTKNLKVSGVYKGKIPLALNERKGKWKLKVIDIITGREDEKEIQFKM